MRDLIVHLKSRAGLIVDVAEDADDIALAHLRDLEQGPVAVCQPLVETEVQSLIESRYIAAARDDNRPVVDEGLLRAHLLIGAVCEGQGRTRLVDEVRRREGQVLDGKGARRLLVPERTWTVHGNADDAEIERNTIVGILEILPQVEDAGPIDKSERPRPRQSRPGLQVQRLIDFDYAAGIDGDRARRCIGQRVELVDFQKLARLDHQRAVVDEIAINNGMVVDLEGRARIVVDRAGNADDVALTQLRDLEQGPVPVAQSLIELEVQPLIEGRCVAAPGNDDRTVIDERLLSTHKLVRAVGEGQGRANLVDEVGRHEGQVLDRHGPGHLLVPERAGSVHVDADDAEIECNGAVRVQEVLTQVEDAGPVHETKRPRPRQGRPSLQVQRLVDLNQTAGINGDRPGRRVGQGVQLGYSQQFTRFDHQRPVVDEIAVDDRMVVDLEGRARIVVDGARDVGDVALAHL